MIVAAGATGRPVVSSAYPEWIAEYMLEQNNGYYPLPVSMSNMLAYLFPATAQAYWDEVLEHAFAANQQRLGSAKSSASRRRSSRHSRKTRCATPVRREGGSCEESYAYRSTRSTRALVFFLNDEEKKTVEPDLRL